MNVKLLSKLREGEQGKIILIRGKAGIHRSLLKLGLIVGRDIHVTDC